MNKVLIVLMSVLVFMGCPNPNSTVTPTTSTDVKVTGVVITTTPLANGLGVTKTLQLEAAVLPADATVKTLSWSSDKPGVASVSDTGLVTGVAIGNAVITATSTDGNKTATFNVEVVEYIPVASMTLIKIDPYNPSSSPEVYPADSTVQAAEKSYILAGLQSTDPTKNPTNTNVTISIEDESILSVEQQTTDGKPLILVSFLKAGKSSLTVTSVDNADVKKVLNFTVEADTKAPRLDFAAKTGASEVLVSFSEVMDETGLTTPANYTCVLSKTGEADITPTISNVGYTAPKAGENSSVTMVFAQALPIGYTLTITANNLKDLAGNAIDASANSKDVPITKELLINLDSTKITEQNGTLKLEAGAVTVPTGETYDLVDVDLYVLTEGAKIDQASVKAMTEIKADGSSETFTAFGDTAPVILQNGKYDFLFSHSSNSNGSDMIFSKRFSYTVTTGN